MITHEAALRVALQAVLLTVLALNGSWGCAFVALILMLPWKPLLAVGGYLAEPLVDWRSRKASERQEKGIAEMEQELDALLKAPQGRPTAVRAARATMKIPMKAKQPPLSPPPEFFKPKSPAGPDCGDLTPAPPLSATSDIPPAIEDHVRSLPQGVFNSMNLEVEDVKLQGDKAEAYVRFQSTNVAGLTIRQRYVLRKAGDHWQVESRESANGLGKAPQDLVPSAQPPMRLA